MPHKFEAGTPDIAGAVGLHAAMDYLDAIGRAAIAGHDEELAALRLRAPARASPASACSARAARAAGW